MLFKIVLIAIICVVLIGKMVFFQKFLFKIIMFVVLIYYYYYRCHTHEIKPSCRYTTRSICYIFGSMCRYITSGNKLQNSWVPLFFFVLHAVNMFSKIFYFTFRCSYYSATEHCKENPGDPAVSFPGCCPTFSCPFSTSPAVAKAK